MRILALDLGRSVGLAYGEAAAVLETIEICQAIGRMMTEFESTVRGAIRRNDPAVLAWERPFVQFGRAPDAQGEIRTQRLYAQAAVCAKLADEFGLNSCFDYPQTVRKAVVGSGKATPEQIMSFCRNQGVDPHTDHAADAYVMWVYAKQKTGARGR